MEAHSGALPGDGNLDGGGGGPALLAGGGGQLGHLHDVHDGPARVVPHVPHHAGGRVAVQPRAGVAHSLAGQGSLRPCQAD